MVDYVDRHVRPVVEEALDEARIVAILGARQTGKSTLLQRVAAGHDARVTTLDDRDVRTSAAADPVAFVRQHPSGLLAIDEIQRVPDLMLALKQEVDRDPRPGRFLVTGSADLVRIPTVHDSLAGRVESINLYGFSQGELNRHRENFIDRFLAGDLFLDQYSELARSDYIELAVAGSYPEALARRTDKSRSRWLGDYLDRIITRDAPEVASLRDYGGLATVLKALAPVSSGTINTAALASRVGVTDKTMSKHLDLLRNLYLVHQLPAWYTNLAKRVVSKPKTMLLDTGLMAHMIGATTANMRPGEPYESFAGSLLETFVVGELRRQQQWAETPARMYHYREHDGAEIDVILEAPNGQVAGIEIKATTNPGHDSTKWLARLRDRLGDRFIGGLVLCSRTDVVPMGDRIALAPIDTIWRT